MHAKTIWLEKQLDVKPALLHAGKMLLTDSKNLRILVVNKGVFPAKNNIFNCNCGRSMGIFFET